MPSPTTSLKPAKRQSLGQSVADELRDAIYSGRFPAGARIGQIAVAREMGVSQTTVRDAFALLERDGLVDREMNQGVLVRRLAPEDVEEIVSLRADLEAMAVRWLIRQADPEHLKVLQQNVRQMRATAGAVPVADLDLDFHELLLRLAGHKRLLACWLTLRSQIKLLMVTRNLRIPDSPRRTVENHKELIRLIEAGDVNGAVAHLDRGNAVYRLHAAPQ